MMTVKINSLSATRTSPIDLGKPKLAKGVLVALSFFQEEKTSTCCHRLVDGIKRIFEKFISFLRCLFCCKCPEKKKESSSDKTESKTVLNPASTANPDPKKKQQVNVNQSQTSPIVQKPQSAEGTKVLKSGTTSITKDEFAHNESFGDFERIHKDVRGLIGEYLDYPDNLKLAISYPDLSEKMYNDLVKEIGMKEVLAIDELADLFKRLKEFSEVFSRPIDKNAGYEIVFKHCKKLEGFAFYRTPTELRKKIALSLPPTITALDFTVNDGALGLIDAELEMFAKKFPQLLEIHLSGCSQITDSGLQALARNCKHLQNLYLNACGKVTDSGIQGIATNCPQLQELSLTACRQVTDVGLQALATHCKHMQSLDLSWCNEITNAGIQTLATNCQKLKKLDLLCCHRITDLGLQIFATNCKQLRDLSLNCCLNISDAGLQALATNCKELQELNLNRCNITDIGLQAIAANSKQLQKLILGHCNITDAGLQTLASNCKQLRELRLIWCTNITNAGLQALAACNNLKTLRLDKENYNADRLHEISTFLPHVEIITT